MEQQLTYKLLEPGSEEQRHYDDDLVRKLTEHHNPSGADPGFERGGGGGDMKKLCW